MNFLQNIKSKLTLWFLFILIILILFFSGLTYFLLSMNIYHVSHQPKDIVKSFIVDIQDNATSSEGNVNTNSSEHIEYTPLLNYGINAEQVARIKSEVNSFLKITIPQGELNIDQKSYIAEDMLGEQEVSLFYRPYAIKAGSYEILAITKSGTEIKYSLIAFQKALIFAVPATLVVAGGLGFFLTRKALKPVDEITKTARKIEEKNLNQRIEIHTKDELGRLAETLNQMFNRLQGAFDRERQFTADASHEMRTPLSVIQGEATLALSKERTKEEYQKSLELISNKASYMTSVVGKLLELARVDTAKERLNFENINLNELLTELGSDIVVLCEEKAINFQLNIPEDLILVGDKVKLKELFLNVLDNAIRYTSQGGKISVSVTRRGNEALIIIEDTGIGIPEEHIPHIFERFYRIDKSRSHGEKGAGLGLSICQRIAELHCGKIEVRSKVGKGSIFTVVLPMSEKA